MSSIVPVLLAGGLGTRLWPLSRKTYPKQFSKILDSQSLFQKSALRLSSSEKIFFEPNITLTHSEFRFIVVEQLMEVGIDTGPVLLEPESKNTAASILAATLFSYNQNNDSILLVVPSDHIIPEKQDFLEAVFAGLKEIKDGKIITFGIEPSRPETGYGYLELDKISGKNVVDLVQFIEKPNKERAIEMIGTGNYLWNSGIFLFRAKDMISAFKKHSSNLFFQVNLALKKSKIDLGFIRLDAQAWNFCENISIDFAIMEKIKNISTVPFYGKWSDLGDWDAVRQEMDPDENGVSNSSNAYALECRNTLLRSESERQVIVGLGLEDIIAIAMPDAVLVAQKDRCQDVKKIVSELKNKNIYQADIFPKDHRPWGWFESLIVSKTFQVKLIHVNPGGALSLQKHSYRSEHWVIVEGLAKVTIKEEVKLVNENESVFIPIGALHRLENPSEQPVIIIEIQTGTYLGEDDIIRYDDIYSRK